MIHLSEFIFLGGFILFIADRFRYLKTGVCVLLLFIGMKMLIHEWVEIDAVTSLAIIVAVLMASIGASMLVKQKAHK